MYYNCDTFSLIKSVYCQFHTSTASFCLSSSSSHFPPTLTLPCMFPFHTHAFWEIWPFSFNQVSLRSWSLLYSPFDLQLKVMVFSTPESIIANSSAWAILSFISVVMTKALIKRSIGEGNVYLYCNSQLWPINWRKSRQVFSSTLKIKERINTYLLACFQPVLSSLLLFEIPV